MKRRPRRGLIFSFKEKKIIISLFLSFWFMAGLSWLPIWQLKQLEFSGCRHLSENTLGNSLSEFIGKNIWWLSGSRMIRRLREIPAVRTVSIKRKFFSTIFLEISERQPFALAIINEEPLVIDKTGLIIASPGQVAEWQVSPFSFQNLALIEGLKANDFESNILSGRILDATQKITRYFQEFIPAGRIKMDYSKRPQIIVLVNDLLPIILGDDSDLENKISVLKNLLPVVWNNYSSIEYLDVAVPSCPIVRYRKASSL